jgi:hypothetical protein
MPHEILRFPPVLQLVMVGLLAAYVVLSVVARVVPGLRWLWRDRRELRTTTHLVEYTLVPALVLAAAAAAVVLSWDPAAPLDGGWTLRELTVGPGAALLGLVAIIAGQVLGRGAALDDASRPGAWIPLLAILVGIALLAVGVMTLGDTVKRARRGDPEVGRAEVENVRKASGGHLPGTRRGMDTSSGAWCCRSSRC